MCQITVVSTKNARWSKILLTYQIFMNSKNSHKDGYGIMAMNEKMFFFKSQFEPAKDITRILENLSHADFKANTFVGHVRLASTINGKKLLGIEKAHPFVDDKLALFHNGTLSPKVGTIPEGLIDSEYFHLMVSNRISKKEDLIPAILTEYRDNWEGKFAFAFPDIFTGEVYLARGFSATLFQAELKLGETLIGTVINTERNSLEDNLEFCRTLFYSTLNIKNLNWAIKEVEKESYFHLNQEDFQLEKLGEFKEQTKKYEAPVVITPASSYNNNYSAYRKPSITTGTIFTNQISRDAVKKIKNFCREWGFNTADVDFLTRIILEIDAENVSITDITTFADYIIPLLEKKILNTSRKIRALWGKIANVLRIMGMSQVDFLYENGLKYPFFFNSRIDLQSVYNELNCASYKEDTKINEEEEDDDDIYSVVIEKLEELDKKEENFGRYSDRYLGIMGEYDGIE